MAFIPTNVEESQEWLVKFHTAMDALDVSKLQAVCAQNVILQYANLPAVEGLDKLQAWFGAQFARLDLMRHDISYFDLVEDKIYQACTINYRIKNDPEKEEIAIPAFGIFRLTLSGEDAGKVRQFEVYIDPTPIRAAMGRAATGN